jgi:hypothetical protein
VLWSVSSRTVLHLVPKIIKVRYFYWIYKSYRLLFCNRYKYFILLFVCYYHCWYYYKYVSSNLLARIVPFFLLFSVLELMLLKMRWAAQNNGRTAESRLVTTQLHDCVMDSFVVLCHETSLSGNWQAALHCLSDLFNVLNYLSSILKN